MIERAVGEFFVDDVNSPVDVTIDVGGKQPLQWRDDFFADVLRQYHLDLRHK